MFPGINLLEQPEIVLTVSSIFRLIFHSTLKATTPRALHSNATLCPLLTTLLPSFVSSHGATGKRTDSSLLISVAPHAFLFRKESLGVGPLIPFLFFLFLF